MPEKTEKNLVTARDELYDRVKCFVSEDALTEFYDLVAEIVKVEKELLIRKAIFKLQKLN